MRTLTNPANSQQITVPDEVADDYVSRGWVAPGAPALAEPGLDSLTIRQLRDFADENGIDLTGVKRKPDIIAAIETAFA